jgi:hypothetical protein
LLPSQIIIHRSPLIATALRHVRNAGTAASARPWQLIGLNSVGQCRRAEGLRQAGLTHQAVIGYQPYYAVVVRRDVRDKKFYEYLPKGSNVSFQVEFRARSS